MDGEWTRGWGWGTPCEVKWYGEFFLGSSPQRNGLSRHARCENPGMDFVSVSEEDSEIVHSIRYNMSKAKPPECFRWVDQPAEEAQEGAGVVAGQWRGCAGDARVAEERNAPETRGKESGCHHNTGSQLFRPSVGVEEENWTAGLGPGLSPCAVPLQRVDPPLMSSGA